jgi:hypothetical protein
MSLKVFNHSGASHTLTATLNLPAGFDATPATVTVAVPPRTEKQADFDLVVGGAINRGTYILTADVEWETWKLPRWTEAIIEVE